MNYNFSRTVFSTLVSLILTACLVCAGCSTNTATADKSSTTVQIKNWEYYTMFGFRLNRSLQGTSVEKLDQDLNAMGAQGWEVAGIQYAPADNFSFLVILKRPLVD